MSESAINGLALTLQIISVVIALLTIVAWWRIFTKASQPGWKSIVPLYNGYILYKLCWKPSAFWIMTVCIAIGSCILEFADDTNVILSLLSAALMIVGLVYDIKFSLRLAKAFGKGTGFGVGLIFFHTIFAYILAFGSAQYIGNPSCEKEAQAQ